MIKRLRRWIRQFVARVIDGKVSVLDLTLLLLIALDTYIVSYGSAYAFFTNNVPVAVLLCVIAAPSLLLAVCLGVLLILKLKERSAENEDSI